MREGYNYYVEVKISETKLCNPSTGLDFKEKNIIITIDTLSDCSKTIVIIESELKSDPSTFLLK